MPATWEPSFNFYLSELEGRVVSFVVDLNAQTLPSHPLRLQVRVPLRSPRPDGLRDSAELEPMGSVEDRIVDRLSAALDAVYVGRFVTAGSTVFVLYLPAGASVDGCGEIIGELEPYEAQWLSESDPSWRFFHSFLYPDIYAFQSMMNRSLLEQLAAGGDSLRMPRQVDHLALFSSRAEAEQAAAALTAKGYRVGPVTDGEAGELKLTFEREDTLADQRPDVFVAEILDVVLPLNGRYDGWGCVVMKELLQ